jgi:hypothetical protein
MELSDRNMSLVLHQADGSTQGELAAEFEVSIQRVGQITKDAREFLDDLELQLLANTKTDEAVAYLVPNGPDRTIALDYFDWVIAQLRARDIKIEVEHRPTTEGSVFFLFDTTYSKGKE